jgi:hypothetical protein
LKKDSSKPLKHLLAKEPIPKPDSPKVTVENSINEFPSKITGKTTEKTLFLGKATGNPPATENPQASYHHEGEYLTAQAARVEMAVRVVRVAMVVVVVVIHLSINKKYRALFLLKEIQVDTPEVNHTPETRNQIQDLKRKDHQSYDQGELKTHVKDYRHCPRLQPQTTMEEKQKTGAVIK